VSSGFSRIIASTGLAGRAEWPLSSRRFACRALTCPPAYVRHYGRAPSFIRVRDFPVAGVRGALYQRGQYPQLQTREAIVTFDDPAIRWVRATHWYESCAAAPLSLGKELPSNSQPAEQRYK